MERSIALYESSDIAGEQELLRNYVGFPEGQVYYVVIYAMFLE